jgi:hypothetical protein
MIFSQSRLDQKFPRNGERVCTDLCPSCVSGIECAKRVGCVTNDEDVTVATGLDVGVLVAAKLHAPLNGGESCL